MIKSDFSQNLKRYRAKFGMTQKELAKKIGISEKSVSKWETQNGLPGIELLVEICNVFNIRLDDLLLSGLDESFYLGIDGGGTKTVFVLIDHRGNQMSRVEKGSTNPNDIGMEGTKDVLKQGINEVCFGYPFQKISMFAGLSGGGTGDNPKILKSFFEQFGFGWFRNGSDIESIMEIGLNACNGIVVILGTGIICYAVKGTEQKRIGGWGKLFDEGGSGYNFGRDAISAVLKAIDGTGEKTIMENLFSERLGQSLPFCLSDLYTKGIQYIASFSDIVFEAWESKDPVAEKIIDRNMKEVAALIEAGGRLIGKEEIPVKFVGGLTKKDKILYPYIKSHLDDRNYRFETILEEPVFGAVKIAQKESDLCKKQK